MGNIVKIESKEIAKALEETSRQYFVGNLARPQTLPFIRDDRLEMGISRYKDYAYEKAHRHELATEYQYVIRGWTQYIDVDTKTTYEFRMGDFYVIMPGTLYAQRIKAGTEILFIKTPSINDKEVVETDGSIHAWLEEKLKTLRRDYYYDDQAPQVNSIRPAAAVAVFNGSNELLMLHRKDNAKWTLPGGTMDYGESLMECAVRELEEETGLKVTIKDTLKIYSDPNIRIAYSDGEVRQEFTVLFLGETGDENVYIDEESSNYKWIALDQVLDLPMAKSQKSRIEDLIQLMRL